MKRSDTPLVAHWLRDRILACAETPGISAIAIDWYRHAAGRVARQLTNRFAPQNIYLRGSAGWEDISPGLSDFDMAFVARADTPARHGEQVRKLRAWVATVPRPWIPLGEVGWMTEDEEELIPLFSLRLPAQHFYRKRFQADGTWAEAGWGRRATSAGLLEHAVEKYLDGFFPFQANREGTFSEAVMLRQTAKFWNRCLAFLDARGGRMTPCPSRSEVKPTWRSVAELGWTCLNRLNAVCLDGGAVESVPTLPQTSAIAALANYLQSQFPVEESSTLTADERFPYFFEAESISQSTFQRFLAFNHREANALSVKFQFPLFTPRLSAYYLEHLLPRVAYLNALFRGLSPAAPLDERHAKPFAADLLYRSGDALVYRRPEKLRKWARAFELMPWCPVFTPLLRRRARLFAECARE